MFAKSLQIYTHQDYLTIEEQAETKSEYHSGHITARAGASLKHNRIVGNVYASLYNALLDSDCEVFMSDLRLWLEQTDRYTYPDLMVVCGEADLAEGRTDTITNPTVIIEVLSQSMANYDRSDKFHAYRTLDSFVEYLLIDQHQLRVEYFRRERDTLWEIGIFTRLEETIALKSIGVELSLGQIYRKVTFETPETEDER